MCLKMYCPLINLKGSNLHFSYFCLPILTLGGEKKAQSNLSHLPLSIYPLSFSLFPSQKTDLSCSSDSLSDGHLGK